MTEIDRFNGTGHKRPDGALVLYSDHVRVLEKIKEENEFLKEYFMDALIQGCGTYHPNTKQYSFDHMCLSTYEHMVKYALKNGWITKEQVTR